MSKASNEPPDIQLIFDRPGQEWSKEEQKQVQVWLHETPQLKRLLGFALSHLGPAASLADAEDAWENFYTKRMQKHIQLYDPARGRRFWNFLLFCFQRYCWEEKEKLKKQRENETSLDRQLETSSGEVIELERMDPSEASDPANRAEKNFLWEALYQCLDELPPLQRSIILLYYFAGEAATQIAETLKLTLANVKVKLFRARQTLEDCLRQRGVEGSLP